LMNLIVWVTTFKKSLFLKKTRQNLVRRGFVYITLKVTIFCPNDEFANSTIDRKLSSVNSKLVKLNR